MHPCLELDHQFMLVTVIFQCRQLCIRMDASFVGEMHIFNQACAQLLTAVNATEHWSDLDVEGQECSVFLPPIISNCAAICF